MSDVKHWHYLEKLVEQMNSYWDDNLGVWMRARINDNGIIEIYDSFLFDGRVTYNHTVFVQSPLTLTLRLDYDTSERPGIKRKIIFESDQPFDGEEIAKFFDALTN